MPDGPAQLNYAAERPTWRRVQRCLPVAVAVGLVGAAGAYLGSAGWRRAQPWLLQSRAVGHVVPGNHVVFTRTETTGQPWPDGRPKVMSMGARSFDVTADSPAPWGRFAEAVGMYRGPIVFLGERRSQAGNVRLVHVYVVRTFDSVTSATSVPGAMTCVVRGRVAVPAPHFGDPREVGQPSPATAFTLRSPDPLSVNAAIPAPDNPSQFTFMIRAGDVTETVDGFLQDDDTIHLVPRNPTATTGTAQEF